MKDSKFSSLRRDRTGRFAVGKRDEGPKVSIQMPTDDDYPKDHPIHVAPTTADTAVIESCLYSTDPEVRSELALNPHLSDDDVAKLCSDPDWVVQMQLINSDNSGRAIPHLVNADNVVVRSLATQRAGGNLVDAAGDERAILAAIAA